ncbi:MAG: HupE/UreJ family protein [Rhodoplanes sp.]|uniref:HupE/UreJ family protein n=1 Tax=Rhodoplanes sp. TaxID=1968906 RepID=UPI00184D9BF3|nr:HupE/UreJ family protein [Rhodoplanes sp.]NVO17794.1 HupE/UreJ family protein [Rhodoplanes sp.]
MTTARDLARTTTAAAAVLLAAADVASAHVGLTPHVHGFGDGFVHPLLGVDHLAAMLAVGLWSATLGGVAMLAVPAAFVGLLVAGAVLATSGVALPAVEPIVTASVVVLGLLVALKVRLPVVAAAAVVGLFGLFHGYAHGAEMPAAAAPLLYGLGFVSATALLHLAGIGVGLVLGRAPWQQAARVAGAGVAALGVVLAVLG